MLQTSIGFFTLAAVLGAYLLSFILKGEVVPSKVVMIHGLFAMAGIALLIIYPFFYKPAPITSLILFVMAAIGGVTMVYMGMSGKTVPVWMAIGHGMVAFIALIVLIAFLVA